MQLALRTTLASAAVLTAAALPLASQGVTPTHTFETPMGFGSFSGEILFATMIAPPAGESIWSTELQITWTTTGVQSPALFGMHLATHSLEAGPSGDWDLTGADLGWRGGAGTYTAVASTDLLNGTLLPGFGGFPPTLDLALEAAGGGGLFGVLGAESQLVFHLGPRADADVASVSLGTGGTQTLSLKAGPTVGPGKLYLVAGSATGTLPFLLDGVNVPLQTDGYTSFSLASANQGIFGNTFGFLDGEGRATAQIAIPAGVSPSLAGAVLHHSMLLLDPGTGELLSASNAVDLLLAP